ncbi:MAG: hypothetical protein JW768_08635 [Chitinispirillaceae bacterium]|nr:hypothetical protein [Chitinispirillaceae bacterium]
MKIMECGCAEKKENLQIFEPVNMSGELLKVIEDFRFPHHEFPTLHDRDKELEIDRLYHSRSTYVVHFASDGYSILAAARIIAKRHADEKLPIEYGRILEITNPSPDLPVTMVPGQLFTITDTPDVFPVCEIGGLRAAEINHTTEITIRKRYTALNTILQTCYKQIHLRGFNHFFLTCIGTPHMERLYHDRYFFNEVAKIRYGIYNVWKALWRLPER